jgi:O-antigen/teichoic acid export membrane protein|tara:strand:- start:6345 stop:7520 length:1176 start_codon:yes stop_codon:yes gene_type:complete
MKLGWDFIRSLLHDTKDVQHVGIGNIAGKVIVGIFWFYMATVLGSENYGQVIYLIALGSMGAAISMVGTSNTLIVYTAKKVPIESALYSIALILGTAAAIVLYIFSSNIIVSIFVFGYIFYNLGVAQLLGNKLYKKYAIILIIQKILFVSLALLFYYIIGFEGVVLGFALSMLVFSYIVLKEFRDTKIDFKILKPRFGFMINNYALTIEKVLNGQVDKLIIAPIFGFALLGNYALSIQFLSIMLIIPSIVFQYTLSQDATGNLSKKIKKVSIGSSIMVACLGIVLSPILIPIIFPDYVEAIQLIQIISFMVIPSSIILAYNSELLGKEKSRFVLIGQGISVSVYLVGLLTLGAIIGINGVAISLVLSSICQAVFYIIIIRHLKNQEALRSN